MNSYLHGYMKRSGFLQGIGVLVCIVIGLGVWGWMSTVKLARIEFNGAINSPEEELLELVDVSVGTRIFDIDSKALKGRLMSHDWVRDARITRLPTGTLRIGISERKPIVLVLDESGRPSVFLDRAAHEMRNLGLSVHDVPLVRGIRADVDQDRSVLQPFLDALADAADDAVASNPGMLISEVLLDDGEIQLRLEPAADRGATAVRLGNTDFRRKLQKLEAFWYQVMMPASDEQIKQIDLRFDNQVITR